MILDHCLIIEQLMLIDRAWDWDELKEQKKLGLIQNTIEI